MNQQLVIEISQQLVKIEISQQLVIEIGQQLVI
jgi:hypothetical protein